MAKFVAIPIPSIPRWSFLERSLYNFGLTVVGMIGGGMATIFAINMLRLVAQLVMSVLGFLGTIISFLFF